jgi:hypothetical protein
MPMMLSAPQVRVPDVSAAFAPPPPPDVGYGAFPIRDPFENVVRRPVSNVDPNNPYGSPTPVANVDPKDPMGQGGAIPGGGIASLSSAPRPAVQMMNMGGAVSAPMPQMMEDEVLRDARRLPPVQMMNMGGAVSSMGNPLDPYRQYLQQTYADPIMSLAAGSIDEFVNAVRQKEQAHFGSPMGGMQMGGMQSPMGGMQMGALQAQQVGQPAPNPSDAFGGQPNFGAMAGTLVNGGNDGFAENRMAQIGQLPAATRNFGSSPFGNSSSNNANLFNARLAQQNSGGPMMASPFAGNPSGASPFGQVSVLQMGRNAGIV